MRRLIALLFVPLTGCTPAAFSTSSSASANPALGGSAGDGELRRVFVAGLTSPPGGSAPSGRPAPRSFARGRMLVEVRPDSTVQYRLDISNPAGETFTGATVHRRRAGEIGAAVIALFTNASIKEREIEVRGTGVVLDPQGWRLLEELRTNPRAFVVVVNSQRVTGASLTGVVE